MKNAFLKGAEGKKGSVADKIKRSAGIREKGESGVKKMEREINQRERDPKMAMVYGKPFDSFESAITGLMQVSGSAAQSLSPIFKWGDTPEERNAILERGWDGTISHLKKNEEAHRENSQPGNVRVVADEGKISYETSGGLLYSLTRQSDGMVLVEVYHAGSRETRSGEKESSLKADCIEAGFQPMRKPPEEGEDLL